MGAGAALRITDIERITLDVPFRERIAPWNGLLVLQWRVVEIIRLTTEDPEVVGYGETLPHYTWGRVGDAAVERARGARLFDLLGDDSLGAGLQMAVYDAAGKAAGVPLWRLLHLPPVREWAPISWWNTKAPPEVLAGEAQEAVSLGYRAHKMKARPWFDVFEQVEAISAVTPPNYRLELDWNDMLLSAGDAAPVLTALEEYERVALFEGPIPQRDIEGYRQLRAQVRHPLALHFGLPPFPTAVREEMCDGFVLSGGIARLLQDAALCAAFQKPFFLQLVGAGLVTALAAHLGAVFPFARWPAVTCLNNYTDDLLAEPLEIRDGAVRVPSRPGLGVTVDEDALQRYRMEPPYRITRPRHILSVVWADGRATHYAGMHYDPQQEEGPHYSHLQHAQGNYALSRIRCWEDFLAGNHPVCERGVRMEVWEDDGSPEWADLYARTLLSPVRERR